MVRVRFAPSPTGRLHVGSAHTALFNWLFARHHGGTFVLRIEDTDRSRVVEGALEDILEGLRWLGLDWDEGPYFQSERAEIYRRHADVLLERGWAYRCFCSPERLERMRREQQARGEPPKYDRRCRNLPPDEVKRRVEAGEPHVVRLKVPLEGETKFVDLIRGEIVFRNSELDDLILLKSDGFPTYHLANVVDDHLMGITHVLRAEEWISSTPKHILLYEAFGWEPPKFAHLPLILGPDKSKLSKRHGATALLDYRDKGYLPEAMANFLALLGWSPGDGREKLSKEEMIEEFSLEGVGKRGSVFDEAKLEWLNGLYIKELPPEHLFDRVLPFWERSGFVRPEELDGRRDWLLKLLELLRERAKKLTDFAEGAEYFFRDPEDYDPQGQKKHWKDRRQTAERLRLLRDRLADLEDFDETSVESATRGLAEELGISAAKLIHPTRLAVSGRTFGPGLFEMLALLGKETVLRRLDRAIEFLEG